MDFEANVSADSWARVVDWFVDVLPVLILKDMGLISGETIAIDSFKIRAQNSLKNNFNQKKIDRHLEYIDLCQFLK